MSSWRSPEEGAKVSDAGNLGPGLQVTVRWHPPQPRSTPQPFHPSHPTGLLALLLRAISGDACLVCTHLAPVYNSCFHFLWLNDPHFTTQLPPSSGWTLSRSRFTSDFVRISCDRNVLTGIVSVYPDPPANRLCSSSVCVRQCASGSGAATGVPRFCLQKLKCQISYSVEGDAYLVLKQPELSTWDEIIGFH